MSCQYLLHNPFLKLLLSKTFQMFIRCFVNNHLRLDVYYRKWYVGCFRMPIQAPGWTEFLSCPVCCNEFDARHRSPISLGCSHTVCKVCLSNLHRKQCPFDQTAITIDIESLPVNTALLQLVNSSPTKPDYEEPIDHKVNRMGTYL